MLDLNLIRENPKKIEAPALSKSAGACEINGADRTSSSRCTWAVFPDARAKPR